MSGSAKGARVRWDLVRAPMRRLMRVSLLWLLALCLVAEAINVPLALWSARHDRRRGFGLAVMMRDGVPPGTRWPTRTPHAEPWPTPTEVDQGRVRFGWWRISPRVVDASRQSQFSAEIDLFGWPLPCFEIVQFWWPWDDPKWAIPSRQTEFIRLRWSGLLINPLLLAGGLWALVAAPLVAWRLAVWRTRLVSGHCPACGYDLRAEFGAGCPECGWNRIPAA